MLPCLSAQGGIPPFTLGPCRQGHGWNWGQILSEMPAQGLKNSAPSSPEMCRGGERGGEASGWG